MIALPNGSQAVLAARKQGMKPAEMLIVSLIGPVHEANHTIYANPRAEYDWRWMVGLKACIYTKPGIDWKPVALAIGMARPEWLGVFDAALLKGSDVYALPVVADIDKPASQWRYQLHFIPWMEFQNDQFAWGE